MRPLIGVPGYATARASDSRPVYAVNQGYIQALEAAGGVPVVVPLFEHAESLEALWGRLDGLLLTGGGDVDPVHYGEQAIPECQPPDAARDALELAVTRAALRERLPLLGICRGMQVLNIVRGGTLYQDLPAQLPEVREHESTTHEIAIAPSSRLAAILGERRHSVNSYHHQAVNRPGEGVTIVAHAPDGVAEALELPSFPFVLAVQFHPELLYQRDARVRRLFEAFVAACAEHATQAAHGAQPAARA